MVHTPENSPPPPVIVNRLDSLDRILTVDPHACGAILHSFGLPYADIEKTEVHITPENRITDYRHPIVQDAIIPHYNASSGEEVHGTGHVWMHMGSVLRASFSDASRALVVGQDAAEDKLYSSLLIDGLSQRADLTIMGREAYHAQKEAAEKALRRAPVLKAIGKNALAAAVGLTADVAAAQYNVLPTPVAWGFGAVGVLAATWWAMTSAKLEIAQKNLLHDIHQAWPAQQRAHRRAQAYLEDPNAQPLMRLGYQSE